MKVAIIGTGLQFKRRLSAIDKKVDQLVGICYFKKNIFKSNFVNVKSKIYDNWKKCIIDSKANIIIVCTPPFLHKEIVSFALNNKKHVLCEKPLTKNSKDAKYLFQLSSKKKKILKCGFNHRHHPAIILIHKLLKRKKDFGKILFARCVYGINGRDDYYKEWRANLKFAAGGQFIEQGVHVIDLYRWLIGDPISVSLVTSNIINKKQKLEESGMAIFKFKNQATALMHTSLTQWENRFSLEIYGKNKYIEMSGLAGSYGPQKIKYGVRKKTGPFEYKYYDFRSQDKSWVNEWLHFKNVIRGKEKLIGGAEDAYKAMHIAEKAYLSEKLIKKI